MEKKYGDKVRQVLDRLGIKEIGVSLSHADSLAGACVLVVARPLAEAEEGERMDGGRAIGEPTVTVPPKLLIPPPRMAVLLEMFEFLMDSTPVL